MRRNWGARVHEVTLAGLRAFVLEDRLLRVTVLAGKGGDVVEFLHKPRDMDFVWWSPGGLRNPRDAGGAAGDDVAAFLDAYEGGWQEVLPNGGAPSVYRGARFAQHGEVAGLPWDAEIVTDDVREVAVRLSVRARRSPLRVVKTFRLVDGELIVEEELTNESDVDVDAMWGHHIVFGAPFLKPGHRIRVPDGARVVPHGAPIGPGGRRVRAGGPYRWPHVPADGGGTVDLSVVPAKGEPSEIVYLTDLDEGRYEVVDPADGLGLRVRWDASVLPHLWLWQELGATVDHPWWGRAYAVGLEPFAGYPTDGLAAAVDNGTALHLGPRAVRRSWLRAGVIEGSTG
ncbi:DUF4432 family protein [Actinomadura sp. WMMB 499]|uniref:DUF4432 family protein n=1 Tax=Actinomadura sp. WMMB 499 TaxID=1219491 RepID=UPI001247E4F2|nr:DUF4432 family protein [Actinomadura sp. WMMB 499]QFG25103.1 aldose 1-epimerase [Actinomadura sp. WMMB 499]